jgi:hypothetical protein
MGENYLIFKGLSDIWKTRNYDLYFYFQEIFMKALNQVVQRALDDNLILQENENSKYKALFVPVGFSIENVALIAAIIKPDYLRLAFTESSRRFHRMNISLVAENIKKVLPSIKITDVTVTNDDQKFTEQKILEWIEEMKGGYRLSYSQIAIDLTGGTKPMSIGAHNAAISFDDIAAFYLRTDYDEDTEKPIPGTEFLVPLKKDRTQVDYNLAFVVMPFASKYDEIYQGIEDAVRGAGMRCLRVDKEIFVGGIMDKIKDSIIKAGVIIADLTEENENVYYELGFSHGISKKVIMLTQNIDNLPFDLRHLRMVIYKPDNKIEFVEQLLQEIEYIKSLQ